MPFLGRIGTFFFLVGIALVALYVISDMAGSPNLLYAGVGVLLGTLGLILRSRYRPEPPPAPARFRILKGGGGKSSGASKSGKGSGAVPAGEQQENTGRSPGGRQAGGKR